MIQDEKVPWLLDQILIPVVSVLTRSIEVTSPCYANGSDVKCIVNFYLLDLCVTGMKGK